MNMKLKMMMTLLDVCNVNQAENVSDGHAPSLTCYSFSSSDDQRYILLFMLLYTCVQ